MATYPRLCPFHNCRRRMPNDRFACLRHWFALSRSAQQEINASYASWQRGDIDTDELRRRQQAVLGIHGDACRGDSMTAGS